ncbi:MAG: hypothetical protein HYZ25_13010 [Chloroflexi bacterium]|nr:hypothetical protein [Chloroflexota bacterium]
MFINIHGNLPTKNGKQKRARDGEGRVQYSTAEKLGVGIIIVGLALQFKHVPIIPNISFLQKQDLKKAATSSGGLAFY